MDGEFFCEESFGSFEGGSDSNLIIVGEDREVTLRAAEAAVAAMRASGEVILPFPGGLVRSGSKVGSRYKKLVASTYHRFCPTLKNEEDTLVPPGGNCVYELVVCSYSDRAIRRAMAAGIRAAAIPGIVTITAGNYGGDLGQIKFPLYEILEEEA